MDRLELRRKNFIKEFPATIASGLTDRLGRLRRVARQAARAARPRRDPRRAGRSAGRTATAKQLGVGFSTYNEMCGLAPSRILGAIRYARGRLGAGDDPVPAHGLGAGDHRHVAPRPGPRDRRGRRSSADQLGCDIDAVEVLHGDTSISHNGPRHLRQPEPPGRGRRALHAPPTRWSRRRARSSPTSSRSSADDLEFANGTFTREGLARQGR